MITDSLEDEISLVMADAEAIRVFAAELSEIVSREDGHIPHAVYVLAEDQLNREEHITDIILELRDLQQ